MQRKRDGLVPIGEAFGGLGGPVKAIREARPGAGPLHPLRPGEPVGDGQRSGPPHRGFIARMMSLCSLPRTNPGNRIRYVRRNGPFTLVMTTIRFGCTEDGLDCSTIIL